jgi:hypothetical protein
MFLSSIHFLFAALLFFGNPDSISKAQLKNLKCINEISSTLPNDIKVYTVSVVAKKEDKTIEYGTSNPIDLTTLIPSGCDVNQDLRDFLAQIDTGKKVYFDLKYMRVDENFPRLATFGFLVTD